MLSVGVNLPFFDSLKLLAKEIFQLPEEVTSADNGDDPEILRKTITLFAAFKSEVKTRPQAKFEEGIEPLGLLAVSNLYEDSL